MDKFDIKIAECLQHNSRQTAEQISDQVGLSPSACQRRMKRMRDQGWIEREIALLSPEVTGAHMVFIVSVSLTRGGAHTIDAFKETVREIPEIQQCYYVTGDVDFILIVTARDIEHYDALTRRVFFNNQNISKFTTTVSMGTVKRSLFVPLTDG